jgi:hypothetical protein
MSKLYPRVPLIDLYSTGGFFVKDPTLPTLVGNI